MLRLTILAVCLLTGFVKSDPNYRLNTPIIPSTYQITITPYFNTGDNREFTFDGDVRITFTTTEAINQIKIHSEDLTYQAGNITLVANGLAVPLDLTNPLEFDTFYAFAHINLQNNLVVGTVYELRVLYEGPIREDLNGFYRNSYIEKGVKKWLGATQMEPTHARKVFPSFDEPELKAVFNLVIDRPATYQPSLGNTKIRETANLPNGYIRETFYPTPRMSTYLVAFLVSEMEAGHYNTKPNSTNEFGVFTRPEATNQTDFAFDFGLKVVDALGEYFGIDYYSTNEYLKLDHIALPNFRAGAMENWGLIKYRESLLLYVPEESNPYYKYRVAQIIAHETTHMWFGNLVTCHWWSNTWLNEGFANYFQDFITAQVEPEVYSNNVLVTGSVYSALDADSIPSSAPISYDNVFSPADISAHFGTISYQKAGSVIRMMHHLLGDAAFKFGLNSYLTTNSFQPGYPNLMYTALELGANATNALAAYNGARIADIMGSWISQPGYPVLEVHIEYDSNSIHLTQRRFYSNGSHSSNEIYKIPITYTTGVLPNFDNTKPIFIMEGETHVFNTTENISIAHNWVIFNVQETGLYRVKYDSHALGIISSALRSADQGRIHYLNRAKIVNDLFAFFFADEISFSVLYDTLPFLSVETNFNVWYAAIRGLNKLRNVYLGTDAVADIEAYSLSLMENIISTLGFEVQESDDFETIRNRMQVLEFACKLGHSGCLENASAMFRDFVTTGEPITPSLRPVSYCAGLRLGNGDDYDFMWHRMSTTNVANEARQIGEILGCSTDVPSLNKFLVSMLVEDSPIMSQDLTVPLSGVLGNHSHVHIVIEGLNENLTLWKSIYPSINTVFTSVAGALKTEAAIDEFEAWLVSCQDCGNVTDVMSTLQQTRASVLWAENHKADILSNMRAHAIPLPSSITLMVACLAAALKFY